MIVTNPPHVRNSAVSVCRNKLNQQHEKNQKTKYPQKSGVVCRCHGIHGHHLPRRRHKLPWTRCSISRAKSILTVDEAKELKAENQHDSAAHMNKAMNSTLHTPDRVTSYKLYGDFRGRVSRGGQHRWEQDFCRPRSFPPPAAHRRDRFNDGQPGSGMRPNWLITIRRLTIKTPPPEVRWVIMPAPTSKGA